MSAPVHIGYELAFSYGHTDLELGAHWHLMGALEALNGWLLFGLTTAFLFTIIQEFGSVKAARQSAAQLR